MDHRYHHHRTVAAAATATTTTVAITTDVTAIAAATADAATAAATAASSRAATTVQPPCRSHGRRADTLFAVRHTGLTEVSLFLSLFSYQSSPENTYLRLQIAVPHRQSLIPPRCYLRGLSSILQNMQNLPSSFLFKIQS